jgi:hypothetical protein
MPHQHAHPSTGEGAGVEELPPMQHRTTAVEGEDAARGGQLDDGLSG